MNNASPKISSSFKNSDLLMAIGVVAVLMLMLIPVPSWFLDIALTFSISISLIIILVSMYILNPLEFSSFPSLLLVVTLLRLALNVASTRLILLHGNEGAAAAGKVIYSFGNFVVGGNYTVGMVVFLILVVINFVVITKGSGRIAEVSARFTLDAMPGKQMAIDADLNTGLIDEAEARIRRDEIRREAEFHGAMDGASKFVRGDAVAGIIITLINVIGGLFIGVLQQKMSLADAAQTYTLLTVGDGLVAQIPALIVSTAAGIIISRAASNSDLGHEVSGQMLGNHRAVGTASGILFLFSIIPGLPHIPFMIIASLVGWLGYISFQASKTHEPEELEAETGPAEAAPEEPIESLLTFDLLGLEVGYGLIPLVDPGQGGELLNRLRSLRKQFALDMGVVVPPIHIRDNLQLEPGQYSLLLKGVEVAGGNLMLGHLLAIDPGTVEQKVPGIPTQDPAFGLPALWISQDQKDPAQLAGYTVVDHSTATLTHVSEVFKSHSFELLGRQEVQSLLDNLSQTHPKAVEELVPNLLSLGLVQKVLQNLLREQIPIRDLLSIVETLADYAGMTRDPDILTEYVRQSLSRSITRKYQLPDGTIPVITLDQQVEKLLAEAVQQTEQGSYLALEPNVAQGILGRLVNVMEQATAQGQEPVVLCSPNIRHHLKRLTERFIPNLVTISYNELSPTAKIQSLGVMSLGHAN